MITCPVLTSLWITGLVRIEINPELMRALLQLLEARPGPRS